jgi:signal transduction histidine kinase
MRIEGHYLCVHDDAGRITGHLGIQRDITERHRSAEEVARSREELRVLAAHLETVREEERRRIARELHDELGQKMTAFKLDLAWLERRLALDPSRDVTDHMHGLLRRLDGVMIAVQRIITELRPSVLDLLGLADAVESYARDFAARTDIELDLAIETDGTLVPDPIATAVFRMLQETLTNIARHAGARRVRIELRNVVGTLSLVVADDGRGITTSQLRGEHSLGILGLRERAIASGGSLDIHGESGRGTTVSLRIPLRCAIE